MGKFLGLPEVLETDDEDENHLGLAGPKKLLLFVCYLVLPQKGHSNAKQLLPQFVVKRDYRQTKALFKARPSLSGSHPNHLSPKPQVGPEIFPFSRNRILPRFEKYYRKKTNLSSTVWRFLEVAL